MLERILGEREPSFVVVGIANWSNHSEIQCGEFSKKLKISLPKGVKLSSTEKLSYDCCCSMHSGQEMETTR